MHFGDHLHDSFRILLGILGNALVESSKTNSVNFGFIYAIFEDLYGLVPNSLKTLSRIFCIFLSFFLSFAFLKDSFEILWGLPGDSFKSLFVCLLYYRNGSCQTANNGKLTH